ncbi:MAG: c-type cytochrome [Kofleriaceae bacterium]|nr:c-type cytochrome [Kofleriaceae bacterium]
MDTSGNQDTTTAASQDASYIHIHEDGGKRDKLTNGIVLDHAYDGIYELDNPMPGWMWVIFIGTIVFSIGYIGYYWFGPGPSIHQEYATAYKGYESKRVEREKSESSSVTEEVLVAAMADPSVLDRGAAIFKEKCVACHAANGEGLVGPNLTDNFQIHGATRRDIYLTIRGGVAGTAMIAWGDQLSLPDLNAAAAYSAALRGKKLAGKGAEGAAVEAFQAAP